MSDFLITYLGTFAAIITIIIFILSLWKRLQRKWMQQFFAKPLGSKVSTSFNHRDLQMGMSKMISFADMFEPDIIIGINRGGAIIGGYIGKHIDRFVYIIEVDRIKIITNIENPKELLKNKRVLLVDDRLTSGTNMDIAYNFIIKYASETKKAVFVWVKDSKITKQIPDEFAYDAKSKYVFLPWEPGAMKEWNGNNS